MTMSTEPATALIHHLREAEDYAETLRRQRDTWIEHAAAKYDEGYERGYADAVIDMRKSQPPVEDWHGKVKGSHELDNGTRASASGSGIPRGRR